MKTGKRPFSPPVFGGCLLLAAFAVLCLTVFVLLSLASVQFDGQLSDKSLTATVSYYNADSKAEEILSALRSGSVPEGVTQKKTTDIPGSVYSFTLPVSDSQELAVDVIIDGSDYRILRWQTVSAAAWEADESIDVWSGDAEDVF